VKLPFWDKFELVKVDEESEAMLFFLEISFRVRNLVSNITKAKTVWGSFAEAISSSKLFKGVSNFLLKHINITSI
jgi:hypothetical protein